MRVGIRPKMVLLLTAVAVVPLLAALATIVWGGRKLQTESVGDMMRAVTASQARMLHASLTGEIEKFDVLLNSSHVVVGELERRKTLLPRAQRESYDRRWPDMPGNIQPMQGTLTGPIAHRLRQYAEYQEQYLHIAEILLTDRYGQLVASTGKTEDFFQADERWWQSAYDGGKGRIHVRPIGRDISANVASVEFCLPIRSGDEVVGIAKVVLAVDQWVGMVSLRVTNKPVTSAIVRRDGVGLVAYVRSQPGVAEQVQWQQPTTDSPGWRLTEDGQVQAYASLDLPKRIGAERVDAPRWVLVLQMSKSDALQDVDNITTLGFGIGLAIIAALFALSLALVDRSITRRIRRLERATRQVSTGDLTHRIGPQGKGGFRLLGTDEINDLVDDFNRMVQRVQESHAALQEANEMKSNFIRVAGHELRTPVTYMLAMEHLVQHSKDPADLQRALVAMTSKARRLDEIIQAIFKLLPTQRYTQELHYSDVDLSALVADIADQVRLFVDQRGQTLIVEVPDDLPRVPADEDKLRDIIENLLMNAVKFTPDGGQVQIGARLQLGGYMALRVTDQGPGIPEQDLEHIFESFFSGSDVMKHSSGVAGYQKRGLGLGLAIVKHFVELHGGDVHVQSGPGGSVFTVTMPLDPPARSIRPQEPPKA